jgi:hypothetical protein
MDSVATVTRRFDSVDLDVAKPAARKPRPPYKPARKPAGKKVTQDSLHAWAKWGGWGLLGLSGLLNGYANALQSPHPLAAWGMGLVIPAIVLLGSHMAGGSHRRKAGKLAGLFASGAIGLLVLSVWHCAESIALITGQPLWLAMPMAVAIDVVLVGCELATLYA